jgi:hypothetical protein
MTVIEQMLQKYAIATDQDATHAMDWFDFEWYVRQGTAMDLAHFSERARQSGHLGSADLTSAEFLTLLQTRIKALDMASARQDVARFIKDPKALDIWSQDYFLQLTTLMRF